VWNPPPGDTNVQTVLQLDGPDFATGTMTFSPVFPQELLHTSQHTTRSCSPTGTGLHVYAPLRSQDMRDCATTTAHQSLPASVNEAVSRQSGMIVLLTSDAHYDRNINVSVYYL